MQGGGLPHQLPSPGTPAPEALASLAPQQGNLHQGSFPDVLGHDEPDTDCRKP
jgi:hypothetical protein